MPRLIFGTVCNHRAPKGVRYILDAVDIARLKGLDFGFLFGERLPHELAMELYKNIDVLIEQLVIGWYGLQACELSLMEKPVVVFLREEDRKFVPPDMWAEIPFNHATKDTLPVVIERVIKMSPQELAHRGRAGREFVLKWLDPMSISKEVVKAYG